MGSTNIEIKKIKERERCKKYYEENKQEINKKMKCKCGEYYTKKHKNRHEKSQLHQDIIRMNAID